MHISRQAQPGARRMRAPKKRTIRTLLAPEQMKHAMLRETARVERGGTGDLTLLLFCIPGWKRHSLSAVRLIKTILKRIRVTDDIGWYDKHHVGLLLPDTTAAGATRLAQEVCSAVGKRGSMPLYTLYEHPAQQAQNQKPAIKVAS